MPELIDQMWVPEHSYGLSRRDRRGGPYRSYVPDRLNGLRVDVESGLVREIARVERRIWAVVVSSDAASGLEGVSRLLLRSEAIAS